MTAFTEAIERAGDALHRRARYLLRFAYYAAVHRGFRNVRWAMDAEGVKW